MANQVVMTRVLCIVHTVLGTVVGSDRWSFALAAKALLVLDS